MGSSVQNQNQFIVTASHGEKSGGNIVLSKLTILQLQEELEKGRENRERNTDPSQVNTDDTDCHHLNDSHLCGFIHLSYNNRLFYFGSPCIGPLLA